MAASGGWPAARCLCCATSRREGRAFPTVGPRPPAISIPWLSYTCFTTAAQSTPAGTLIVVTVGSRAFGSLTKNSRPSASRPAWGAIHRGRLRKGVDESRCPLPKRMDWGGGTVRLARSHARGAPWLRRRAAPRRSRGPPLPGSRAPRGERTPWTPGDRGASGAASAATQEGRCCRRRTARREGGLASGTRHAGVVVAARHAVHAPVGADLRETGALGSDAAHKPRQGGESTSVRGPGRRASFMSK